MKPEYWHKIGMHPLAPRWFKLWCLRMIMRHVEKELAKKIKSMTPEQRAEFDKRRGNFNA